MIPTLEKRFDKNVFYTAKMAPSLNFTKKPLLWGFFVGRKQFAPHFIWLGILFEIYLLW